MAAKKIIVAPMPKDFKYYTRTFWKIFFRDVVSFLFFICLGGRYHASFEDLENLD
jgi:hypothetical protein